MSEWQPIATVPHGLRVIIFDPSTPTRPICEAYALADGQYWDPTYDDWDASGATHWMPLPPAPESEPSK